MIFTRLEIPDLILCEPTFFGDDRGYFGETFRQDKLDDFLGYNMKFVQENESKSMFGVLRGLHYQLNEFAQAKLVRVLRGSVLDVAVDIRENSKTFGKYISVELSFVNKKQLLVPRGFAHGFVVLSDEAIFSYKVDNYYAPNSECGILFDDLDLGIDWNLNKDELKLSAKDKAQPTFKNAKYHSI